MNSQTETALASFIVPDSQKAITRRLQVSLITGSLGSGKTTLLEEIVSSPSFDPSHSALLINDAGPINIDAKVFRGRANAVRTLTGGCICCVNPEEMKSILLELSQNPQIETVWIEASGIAQTDDILDRLMDQALVQKVQIRNVIHLINAETFSNWFTHAWNEKVQAQFANRIIINKIDLISPELLEKISQEIESWNPSARIEKTLYSHIDLSQNSNPLPLFHKKNTSSLKSHRQWNTSWIPIVKPQNIQKVTQFLNELPPEIYRVKGFIPVFDKKLKTYFVQKVGILSQINVWEFEGNVEETGLVLLGQTTDEELQKAEALYLRVCSK